MSSSSSSSKKMHRCSEVLEVVFKVTADLRIGEEVRLSGSAPALGFGDVNRAIPLFTTPATYPSWTTKEAIFLPGDDGDKVVTYRYAVFSGGVFSRWEKNHNEEGGEEIVRRIELMERRGISGVTEDVLDVPSNLIPKKHYESMQEEKNRGRRNSKQSAVMSTQSERQSIKNRHFTAWGKRPETSKAVSQDDRIIVVSYILPVVLSRSSTGEWSADWDNESILSLQSENGRQHNDQGKISWVGSVRHKGSAIAPEDQAAVTEMLHRMECYPVYITAKMHHRFYDVFCKQHLWLILHHVADVYGPLNQHNIGAKAQQELWFTYSTVNNLFRDKVIEAFHQGDMVWIHGFHLMLLPSFLRRVLAMAKIGYFFHTPFPSSEIWRTMTRRKDLLRGILAADQIGFHLYEYARHFITTCHRVVGNASSVNDNGQLVVTVDEREVAITCIHIGVDMPKVKVALSDPTFDVAVNGWKEKLGTRKIIFGGIDRLERLKGIPLKLICIDQFLEENPEWRGKVSFSIIGISASERGDDYRITVRDVKIMAKAINAKYSSGPGDFVVHFEERSERDFNLAHRMAYFSACDMLLVTATRDGLNRIPIEFTLARNNAANAELAAAAAAFGDDAGGDIPAVVVDSGSYPKGQNLIVISEFISSARVMRGAITINPWRLSDMKAALHLALTLDKTQQQERFCRNLDFSTRMTTQNWAVQVLSDLKAVQKDESAGRTLKLGFALGFKVMGTSTGFNPVDVSSVSKSYRAARSRVIVLDWGGTLVADDDKKDNLRAFAVAQGKSSLVGPSPAVCSLLEKLTSDVRNNVFVVSGKELVGVSEHFGHIRNLGLGAEHGFYYRWPRDEFVGNNAVGGRGSRSGSEGEYLPQTADSEDSDSFDINQSNVRCRWQTLAEVGDQSWKEPARLLMSIFVQRTHGTYVEEKGNALIWQFRDADPEFGFLQSKELEDHLQQMLHTNLEVEVIRGGGVSDGYIEVRPTGVSKGLFLQHVLATLKNLHRSATFVMAIGDDNSDEPMFEHIQQLSEEESIDCDTFGITVGKKPSAAGSYVNDSFEVLELLNTLARSSHRDKKHFSAVDLPSQAGGPAHSALKENFTALNELKRHSARVNYTALKVPTMSKGTASLDRAMSVGHLPLSNQEQEESVGLVRTLSSAHLTMNGYLESINDTEGDNDDGIFF
jgi:trehalose 6-phosphate synthase/phosphatase